MDAQLPGAMPAPRLRRRWRRVLGGAVSAYLPLLLMATLALGTWWLVKRAPVGDEPARPRPLRHEPDYTMDRFTMQRHAADGQVRLHVEGEHLRHYPDTETVEIDTARLRAIAEDGTVTRATAKRAVVDRAASTVELLGGARVVREADESRPEIRFAGEYLHVQVQRQQVRSHLPALVQQEGREIRAAGFAYDHQAQTLQLVGPISMRFEVTARPGAGR